jgi:hypothetical protein
MRKRLGFNVCSFFGGLLTLTHACTCRLCPLLADVLAASACDCACNCSEYSTKCSVSWGCVVNVLTPIPHALLHEVLHAAENACAYISAVYTLTGTCCSCLLRAACMLHLSPLQVL